MDDNNNNDPEIKYINLDIDTRKVKLNDKMIEWSKKGDVYHFKMFIDDEELDLDHEEKESKWTSLFWAIVNNHKEIAIMILNKKKELFKDNKNNDKTSNDCLNTSNNSKDNYNKNKNNSITSNISKSNSIQSNNLKSNTRQVTENILNNNNNSNNNKTKKIEYDEKTLNDLFKKPLDKSTNQYTAIHWAAYKARIIITSLLIKDNYNPLAEDMYGNNALHQAAASNNRNMFKLFMGLGYDIEPKNSRNHTPYEMTSNEDIKDLIKRAIDTKECFKCNKRFNFYVTRYLCAVCENLTCKECCVSSFYYENADAKNKELLECRCIDCYDDLKHEEIKLNKTIQKNNLEELEEVYLNSSKHKRINPKLKVLAEANIDRLIREKSIISTISNLDNVKDHKTIEKSIHYLLKQAEEAKENGILIDNNILEKVNIQKDKKTAEKELRRLLNNVTVFDSSEFLKTNLEEKLNKAEETKVDLIYIDEGKELLNNVKLNLKYIDTYNKLFNYPPRVYPEVEDNSKKKKKEVKPKKKRKKKEPPFPTPEWAVTSKEVKDKIDEYLSLIKMGANIGLNEQDVLDLSKPIVARFKKEIDFRKREEEEQRLIEEEKEKKAKKNLKKK